MSGAYRLYVDDEGLACAAFPPRPDPRYLLGYFLEGDVQGSVDNCQMLLDSAAQVESGIIPRWSNHGNAYYVTLLPGRVKLSNADAEERGFPEKVEVPLRAFIAILEKWKQMLLTRQPQEVSLGDTDCRAG